MTDENETRGESKGGLAQSEFDPLEDEAYRGEMLACRDLRRGRSSSAPPCISSVDLVRDKGNTPVTEVEVDLGLVKKEWKSLLSDLRLVIASDAGMPDAEESGMDVEMARGASDERPASPFASIASSADYGLDGGLSGNGLIPAYAVAFGQQSIDPTPVDKANISDFGAPGDYKNSVAFRRALPALVKGKHVIVSGGESVISDGSERDASEPKWDIPSYGVVPEADRGILSAQSIEQRIEIWLDNVLPEVAEWCASPELPPITPIEPDGLQHADWENLREPSEENVMVTPTPSEVERELEQRASLKDDESASSHASLTCGFTAEDWGHDDFHVPDDPFPGPVSQMWDFSCGTLSDKWASSCGTSSDNTTHSHHIGSSTISEGLIERFAAPEAITWTNAEAERQRRETRRERVKVVEGRGSIAGENLGEARNTRKWYWAHPAPLEVFAQFLEDKDVSRDEYLDLNDRFDRAFRLGLTRSTRSWPVRHQVRPCEVNWGVTDGWGCPVDPVPSWEQLAEEDEDGSLSFTDSEEEGGDLEQILENKRRSRFQQAYARGRSAGLIDGIAAFREAQAQVQEETWCDDDDSHYRPSLSMFRRPRHRDLHSVEDDNRPRRNHLGEDPYVTHFVDDTRFPLINRAEMEQLAKAFRDGYDETFSTASTNTAGFVTSLRVIPSLEEFMEGTERIFH